MSSGRSNHPSSGSTQDGNRPSSPTNNDEKEVDARMEEARRRFGLRGNAGQAPVTPVSKPYVKTSNEQEPDMDWNEVWGDYVTYMSHQR